MDNSTLQATIVLVIVVVFALLLMADVIDEIGLGGRYQGPPRELYPVVMWIFGLVFRVVRRGRNGKPKEE